MRGRDLPVGLLGVLCWLQPAAASGQEPTPEQIAAVAELAKPGPEHALLAGLVGEWDQRIIGWPEPGSAPFELAGTAVNRPILGGRFLESQSTGSYAGVPVEAVTIFGFDRRHGEYTAILMDSQGTYWITAQGERREDGSIVMRGTDDMVTLNHVQVYDVVLRIDGPDRYVIEIVFQDDMHRKGGPPFKAVEIVHTRRVS